MSRVDHVDRQEVSYVVVPRVLLSPVSAAIHTPSHYRGTDYGVDILRITYKTGSFDQERKDRCTYH